MKPYLLFSLFLIIFVAPVVGQEQTNTSPLLDLLALVPDNEAARSQILYYQDFRAVENARDYLSRPENGEAFIASDPWLGFTRRWLGAPSIGSRFVRLIEAMPATVGFDFFDINRMLTFAPPPQTTVIWSGDFDFDAIGMAHAARGYQQVEIGDLSVWCGEAGCDAGTIANARHVELGNIFDENLGRQVPFLTLPGTLVSSPTLQMLQDVASTDAGTTPSLLDARDYRTLAEAITDPTVYTGELVSARLINPNNINMSSINYTIDLSRPSTLRLLNPTALTPQLEEMAARGELPDFVDSYGELPTYNLVALADRQEGDVQVAVVALLYRSQEDAEIAATEMTYRLRTFSDAIRLPSDEPFFDLFPSASIESRVMTNRETGMSAAIVQVLYPTPTQEEEQTLPPLIGGGPPRLPAAYYQFLIASLELGKFYPLWYIVR